MSRTQDNANRLVSTLHRYAADPHAVQQIATALNYYAPQLQEDMESLYQCNSLSAATADQWSNDACIGYAITAMQATGLNEEQIQAVVAAMVSAFDFKTLEDAERIYSSSPY